MNQEIVCINFRILASGSCLKGFAEIYVPDWDVYIRDIQLFEKDGRIWIRLPSRMYEKDGEKKYSSYIRFKEKNHADLFHERVLRAVKYFKASNRAEDNNSQERLQENI